jgi:deoxyadenosine/deoxycytidine kinase
VEKPGRSDRDVSDIRKPAPPDSSWNGAEYLSPRIIARSREAETSISLDYLKALSRAILLRIESVSNQIPVITIDSHAVDFRSGIEGIRELESI